MKVLIGIDGSELARRAARQALALVKDGAEVILVGVARPVVAPLGGATGAAPTLGAGAALVQEATEAMEREVAEEVASVARELDVAARTRVLIGDPRESLCAFAAEQDADLLVVGSHGRSLLERALLGSVSHYVLHHAPCPVLVVRQVEED